MTSAFKRGLQIIELLTGSETGLPLNEIADTLEIPRSAAHRLLAELIETGFVYQVSEMGNYCLGLKIVGLGQRHLAASNLAQLTQPTLKELAEVTGELVRLAVRDNDRMFWVAKSQGAKHGLRYDPEAGAAVTLSCSATGIAWMSTLPEEEALSRILRQGIGSRSQFGPRAPETIDQIRDWLREARKAGYATQTDTFTVGIASIAAPIMRGHVAEGILSIAGPTARLNEERLQELKPLLTNAISAISAILSTTGFSG